MLLRYRADQAVADFESLPIERYPHGHEVKAELIR
jgi:hypothetical protein